MFVFGNVCIRCLCVLGVEGDGERVGTGMRQKEESAINTKENSGIQISQNLQMSFQEYDYFSNDSH